MVCGGDRLNEVREVVLCGGSRVLKILLGAGLGDAKASPENLTFHPYGGNEASFVQVWKVRVCGSGCGQNAKGQGLVQRLHDVWL